MMQMQLPKSAVLVLKHLVMNGPMCPVEICATAKLAPRTVSHALKRLLEDQLCYKIPNLQDMRRPLYTPNFARAKEVVASQESDSIIGTQITFMFPR